MEDIRTAYAQAAAAAVALLGEPAVAAAWDQPSALLRSLSRAERAPATIAAF